MPPWTRRVWPGPMIGRGQEVANFTEQMKVTIMLVKETKWNYSKAKELRNGFKLFCINWRFFAFTGKIILCCCFRICTFQYFHLSDVITAIYLLSRCVRQKKICARLVRETPFIHCVVKSGSQVLTLVRWLISCINIDATLWQSDCKLRDIPSDMPILVLMPHAKSNCNMK